jgi:enamine deaminase RidA (YjgF/YER057c/UK114 family)
MKEFRNPHDVHQPVGGYTHQIEITGNERMLMLSGQVGMRVDGTIPEDPLEQIGLALGNIFRNLQAANMGVKDLVKLTYYLVGDIDTAKRRELVAAKLQGHKPCSTLLYVARLATPDLRVEIDAWASRAD